MANNRMYLCCTHCALQPETSIDDCLFFLAKYYPTTGWYVRGGKVLREESGEPIDFVDALDAWFDRHKHGGMYGEYIYTIFESFDPTQQSKRDLLDGVAQVLANPGADRA